jgi:hypothetical protein
MGQGPDVKSIGIMVSHVETHVDGAEAIGDLGRVDVADVERELHTTQTSSSSEHHEDIHIDADRGREGRK